MASLGFLQVKWVTFLSRDAKITIRPRNMSQRGQVPLLVGLLLKPLLGCIADVLGGPKPLPVGSGDVVDLLPLYFHCLYNNISTAL